VLEITARLDLRSVWLVLSSVARQANVACRVFLVRVRMICRTFFVFATIITVCLLIVSPVSAHGRTPRLEISVERLNPGGVLDIRGVEFDYEEVVTLYLERQGLVIELGQIVADLEGILIHTIVLPPDLPIGTYTIRGVTEHHDVLSPVLTVQGLAILSEGGGQGERDEDDGLLAPMPTYAPGVVPGGVPPTEAPLVEQDASAAARNPVMVLIILLVGILVVAGARATRKA
jgi:hypothetical protein